MIKKTFTYTDYNGVERTEDAFFHLNKAEIMEMELTTEGGMAEQIDKIVKAKNTTEIIKVFKDLILKAYGKKSEDGRRFIKNQQLRDEFEQTEMYPQLFMELATDDEAAANFIIGIMPSDIDEDKKQGILDEVKKSQQER